MPPRVWPVLLHFADDEFGTNLPLFSLFNQPVPPFISDKLTFYTLTKSNRFVSFLSRN